MINEMDQQLEHAFEHRLSDMQVKGCGMIIKLLPDDRDGIQHQRFIIQLSSGRTLLIAHNSDLAPRVHPIHRGDFVEFYGESEWNSEGGVIHWTPQDPIGDHIDG